MSSYKQDRRKMLVAVMALSLMSQPALSSQISNVVNPGEIGHIDGDSVVTSGSSTIYNIVPTAVNGDIGFRHYKNFTLSEGDIANLIFKYGEEYVSKFVNFVDKTVTINGILNTMRDNNFYNGHAIFVSPSGMVVGASGVLNVGALSVLTPSQTAYEKFSGNMEKYAPILSAEGTSEYDELMDDEGTGSIVINGKVISRNSVNLNAADVSLGSSAGIIAGVNDSSVTTLNDAEVLFNSLVNTNNLASGNSFSSENGSITIKAYGTNGGVSADSDSVMKNFGSGDITITSKGSKGAELDGLIANADGNVSVTSNSGITVDGIIKNQNGTMTLVNNTSNGILINENSEETLYNNNGELNITNAGSDGIRVKGNVYAHGVNIDNKNSDVVIGNTSNDVYDNYITSNGDINININNGSLLNAGVAKTLLTTENSGNLNINVVDGTIGTEVGACDNGICTGIGPDQRDLTKSINGNISGTYTAVTTKDSTSDNLVINLAALESDMKLENVSADGRVILLADSYDKGSKSYDILNGSSSSSTTPNVEGYGISMIASGDIGTEDNKVTFIQTKGTFDDSALTSFNYNDNSSYGVDMLAIGDINVKGLDNSDGSKNDTNVCAMISRTGDINAEFSGDTYIREITAANEVNIVNRGQNLYIDNLGSVPTYETTGDYYGSYSTSMVPDKVTVSALDLGTASNPNTSADSTVIIKNGQIDGDGEGRGGEQDLTIVADNAYAGGYYFNMGKHRNGGVSTITEDSRTNAIKTPDGNDASIRVSAVRPDDVTKIGKDSTYRNYYYGGSEQNGDGNYDVDGIILDDSKKGGEDDDDNLVVPTTEPTTAEPTTAEPTTAEPTTAEPTTAEPTTAEPTTAEPTTAEPTTAEPTTAEPTTAEPTTAEPTTAEPTTAEPTTAEPTTAEPTTAEPTTAEPTTAEPTTAEPTTAEPTTAEPTTAEPTTAEPTTAEPTTAEPTTAEPTTAAPAQASAPAPSYDKNALDGETWIQHKDISDYVPTVDKRQYMRFDAGSVQLISNAGGQIESLIDISRGGMAVTHNNSIKVGDVIPVQLAYGDISINADVKCMTASDVRAGVEFTNLDEATQNKLLFLSMLMEDYQELSMLTK